MLYSLIYFIQAVGLQALLLQCLCVCGRVRAQGLQNENASMVNAARRRVDRGVRRAKPAVRRWAARERGQGRGARPAAGEVSEPSD